MTAIQFPPLVVATILLSFSAMIAWLAIATFRPKTPLMYRMIWFSVLIQGILLFKFSVDLSIPATNSPASIANLFVSKSENPSLINFTGDKPIFENNISSSASNLTETELGESPELARESAADNIALKASPRTDISMTVFEVAVLVWLVGIGVIITFVVIQYVRYAHRFSKPTAATNHRWQEECDRLAIQFGFRRPVPVVVDENCGPLLFLSPRGYRLVVPEEAWDSMSVSQRAAVLRHELEHLRRHDVLKSLFGFFITTVHWFNPLAWMALRQWNQAAEWACDDAAAKDGNNKTEFARAILTLTTNCSNRMVAALGFGSSSTKSRIKRLFDPQPKSSPFQKLGVTSTIIFLGILGWVNLRLIPAPALAMFTATFPSQDERNDEKRIDEFVNQLATSDDGAAKFADIAKTNAGKIVIGQRIAEVENMLRAEAAKAAVPEFFANEIDDDFRLGFNQELTNAQAHLAKLEKAFSELSGKIRVKTDSEKLFKRFLDAPKAAIAFYVKELRQHLIPNEEYLMRELSRFLAKNNDGKFVVRDIAKDQVMRKISRFEDVEKHLKVLRDELKLMSDELLDKDEFHSHLKKRLASSRGANYVMAMAFDSDDPVADRVEAYFEQLDHFFEDAPEGLVIHQEAREHLKEAMAEMDRNLKKLELLSGPLKKIIDQIDESRGDEERAIKNFLGSEVGMAVLSQQFHFGPTSIEEMLNQIQNDVLQTTDDGLIVMVEKEEEVAGFAREMLRAGRQLRRRLSFVENRIESAAAQNAQGFLESDLSKLLMFEKVSEYVRGQKVDGWPIWIENHFSLESGRYVIRDEAKEVIAEIAKEAQQIEQELAKDDF